jgi:hypothetical protein
MMSMSGGGRGSRDAGEVVGAAFGHSLEAIGRPLLSHLHCTLRHRRPEIPVEDQSRPLKLLLQNSVSQCYSVHIF